MKGFPLRLMGILLLIDVIVMCCTKTAELSSVSSANLFECLLRQPAFWLGLLFSLLQLWTWTRILACTRLSLAYPIASLSYPLTMIAAQCFFAERLNGFVWMGGLLIALGVAVVGSASKEKSESPQLIQEAVES